jgi:general stress protein 26
LDLSLGFIATKELKKVKDIQNNSEFSACFMIQKLLQRIEGKAELITDKEQIYLLAHGTTTVVYKRLYHK